MPYAEDTKVSVEKSRTELETILRKYKANAFGYMTDDRSAVVQFRANNKNVRFVLPLPDPKEDRFWVCGRYNNRRRSTEAATAEWEQACRSSWRALVLAVKAKLEAVERKISTFETEFLAHIVLPNGHTVAEEILPMVEESCETGRMPAFSLALPEHSET